MGIIANYFSKAGRAAPEDMKLRSPELRHLAQQRIAVFGAGCLGACCILELARAGVGELCILDGDAVDPGTISRWSLGMSAVGLPKVLVLQEFIERNYPLTVVRPYVHRLGAIRSGKEGEVPDREMLDRMTDGASLILDATAELGVQHVLADTAADLGIPFVSVVGTYGGWGGKVVSVRPGTTKGCWMCARWAFDDGTILEPPSDEGGMVQAQGCGDVTFTGAGFDMSQVAIAGVRTAVSVLSDGGEGSYPAMPWDVTTIALRDESGRMIPPEFKTYCIEKHAKCPICNAK